MIDGLLTLIFIVGLLISAMFIISAVQNVREQIAKNRRIDERRTRR